MPRVLTSTPVFSRIFPGGIFIFAETQKDKLFEHGMNATGLAVQSSHTGVAICNINTCKIHHVKHPFSNRQPESASERLRSARLISGAIFRSVLHYSAHGFSSFVHSTKLPHLNALHSGGHPAWQRVNIIK